MKTFRKIIFWLHLAAGITAGLIVLVMSATGVILTYERQMTDSADVPEFTSAGESLLSPEALIQKTAGIRPDAVPSSLMLSSDPSVPASVGYGREVMYVNPYTGLKLEPGSPGTRTFFQKSRELHRWLAATGDYQAAGKAVTGAANLVFLFLVVSGIYLWWPRKWNWRSLRPVVWFRRKLDAKARNWNWHNVLGFWSSVPLFFIVITGAFISYPWASDLLYSLTGDQPPPRRPSGAPPGGASREGQGGKSQTIPDYSGVDTAWAKVKEQAPSWKTISLALPKGKEPALSFTVMEGHRGRPDLRSTVTTDRTGTVTATETFDSFKTGRKLQVWSRWIHTGEAGGIAGQTIAGIASAAAVVLVWTGFALALRRFFGRKRQVSGTAAASDELPAGIAASAKMDARSAPPASLHQ